jgi:hypothetical protein
MALVADIRRTDARAQAPVAPLAWAAPEAKLWVATRGGEYAGMVEYLGGHYECSGATGEQLRSASDLAQAKAIVEAGRPSGRITEALLSNVALATAVVAVSVAGITLTALAA